MLNGTLRFGEPLTVQVMFFRVMAAVIIGGLIGVDREIKNRPAGMRTHVLVCVGAVLVALIEMETISCVLKLNAAPAINLSAGRITSAVISGVGFLGAGTIFIADRKISGLTTAASLWCTACIGLAIGMGFIVMGVACGVIVLVVLRLMQRIVHVNTLKRL